MNPHGYDDLHEAYNEIRRLKASLRSHEWAVFILSMLLIAAIIAIGVKL